MGLQKWVLKTTAQHQGQRLDDVLVAWLPGVLKQSVSKGKVRKLIIAGAVYLNGKRVRIASKVILEHAQIQIFLDLAKLNSESTRQDRPFEMTPERVVFEDEHLIVINKPPGLPTQPTLDESRDNLFAAVKRFISKREKIPADQVYVGLHHRLDRDTSGLILMTKTKEANPGIADLFKNHGITKIYYALTGVRRSSPLTTWEVKNYLGRSKSSGKKNYFSSVRSGGDFAHTEFRLIENLAAGYWIEARPLTGRTHQIRVHLSEDGMAILGDPTYSGGDESNRVMRVDSSIPRLMLHAVSLTFTHPILKTRVSIQSHLPEDFNQCLNNLRQRGRDLARRPLS
jgi:RluA family pseudouridine synthase